MIATLESQKDSPVIHPKNLEVGEIAKTECPTLYTKIIFRISSETFLGINRGGDIQMYWKHDVTAWGESNEAYTKLPKGTTLTLTF